MEGCGAGGADVVAEDGDGGGAGFVGGAGRPVEGVSVGAEIVDEVGGAHVCQGEREAMIDVGRR